MKLLIEEETTKIEVVERNEASKILTQLPEQFQKLWKSGRLCISWQSLRFCEHIPLMQCFECLRFGHVGAKYLIRDGKIKVMEKCRMDKILQKQLSGR